MNERIIITAVARDAKIAFSMDSRHGRGRATAVLQRRMFTTDEYHRLVEAGILHEDDRVELLDGDIVEMAPIGSRHAACVDRLIALLQPRLGQEGILRVQGPIRLDDYSEPEPDVAVLKPRADFYASGHPAPNDVMLVIEVADTSVRSDREIKTPLYARAGIIELWVVDLVNETVDVLNGPTPQGYQVSRRARRGEPVPMSAIHRVDLTVDDVLGPPTNAVSR